MLVQVFFMRILSLKVLTAQLVENNWSLWGKFEQDSVQLASQIHYEPGYGFSLVATKNVKRGEAIFALPAELTITSFSDDIFRDIVKNTKLQEVRLISNLMRLRFMDDVDTSWARQYVQQIPEIIQKTPNTAKLNLSVGDLCTFIISKLQTMENISSELFEMKNCEWAYRVVETRGIQETQATRKQVIGIPYKDADLDLNGFTMFPLLDLVTPWSLQTVKFAHFDKEYQIFQIKNSKFHLNADRDIAKGQQIIFSHALSPQIQQHHGDWDELWIASSEFFVILVRQDPAYDCGAPPDEDNMRRFTIFPDEINYDLIWYNRCVSANSNLLPIDDPLSVFPHLPKKGKYETRSTFIAAFQMYRKQIVQFIQKKYLRFYRKLLRLFPQSERKLSIRLDIHFIEKVYNHLKLLDHLIRDLYVIDLGFEIVELSFDGDLKGTDTKVTNSKT